MKDIYGEEGAKAGVERRQLPFKFVFLLLRTNDRWGGARGQRFPRYGSRGIFKNFSIPEG